MVKTLIMIPTYNEKENIEGLINEIFKHVNEADILVVDDNSPDGTGLIADKIAKQDNRVSVLHRTSNRGRGYAGIDGFKEAIKRKDVRYIIEMDGDFSHDPKHIPAFLKEIKGSDVVIGSRYIDGGRDCDRGPIRVFLSKSVNLFIRKYLKLNIKDCTSGYRCFRRSVIEDLDLDNIISKEPSIIEEVLYKCSLKKCLIKEIPIVFKKRYNGKSKLGIIRLVRVLKDILRLKGSPLPEGERVGVRGELRRFGFNLGLGLNIVGCIMFYRGKPHFIWFSTIGSLVLIAAILCPSTLTFLKKILDRVIFSFGWIVNKVTLIIAFYLIFTPIALLLRLFGRDLLHQKIDKSGSSYWSEHKKLAFSKGLYERMG
ncbi:MAG: polyprenol monophosphomannose synthase [Candidatus Omnitrophica bacterium]|nr:polyprenol monophosphomannose synthase [Candidatus Omnitrophota bacterium]